jgi:Gas vesicle protein G
MGLLTKLLTFPVSLPMDGVVWVAGKLLEQAETELYNEPAVRGKLMELELRYDLGEIDEEAYLAAEDALLARLRLIRERAAARSG